MKLENFQHFKAVLIILVSCLLIILTIGLGDRSALAATIDSYVARYLHVTEPIALKVDTEGHSSLFSPADLSKGKQIFQNNCMSCHVGGATLPNPLVSLGLTALRDANPPRDNIANLVAYFRQPMFYDGSEVNDWCRQIPESWMSQEEVTQLAAFVLTAANKAPGWGTDEF